MQRLSKQLQRSFISSLIASCSKTTVMAYITDHVAYHVSAGLIPPLATDELAKSWLKGPVSVSRRVALGIPLQQLYKRAHVYESMKIVVYHVDICSRKNGSSKKLFLCYT